MSKFDKDSSSAGIHCGGRASGRAGRIERRHLAQREIFGETRRRATVAGAAKQREKSAARWVGSCGAAAEIMTDARAAQCFFDERLVLIHIAEQDGDAIEGRALLREAGRGARFRRTRSFRPERRKGARDRAAREAAARGENSHVRTRSSVATARNRDFPAEPRGRVEAIGGRSHRRRPRCEYCGRLLPTPNELFVRGRLDPEPEQGQREFCEAMIGLGRFFRGESGSAEIRDGARGDFLFVEHEQMREIATRCPGFSERQGES